MANNIAAHESLFRLGIVSDLFVGSIVIFVALALYRLSKGVEPFNEENSCELQITR